MAGHRASDRVMGKDSAILCCCARPRTHVKRECRHDFLATPCLAGALIAREAASLHVVVSPVSAGQAATQVRLPPPTLTGSASQAAWLARIAELSRSLIKAAPLRSAAGPASAPGSALAARPAQAGPTGAADRSRQPQRSRSDLH